jgi:hypothetical protein
VICLLFWFCCSFATPTWSGRRRGMTKRRQAVQVSRDQSFKGRQFTAEVILWAVRWYLMFPISYRDLELMLLDRALRWTTPPSSVGARFMLSNWRSGSAPTCA